MANKFEKLENPAEMLLKKNKKNVTTEGTGSAAQPDPAQIQAEEPKHVPNPKGRPKAEKPKSKRIGLVAEPELYAQMEEAAERLGISVAGFIRQSVLLNLERLDLRKQY